MTLVFLGFGITECQLKFYGLGIVYFRTTIMIFLVDCYHELRAFKMFSLNCVHLRSYGWISYVRCHIRTENILVCRKCTASSRKNACWSFSIYTIKNCIGRECCGHNFWCVSSILLLSWCKLAQCQCYVFTEVLLTLIYVSFSSIETLGYLNWRLFYAFVIQVGQFVNCLVEAKKELQHRYCLWSLT